MSAKADAPWEAARRQGNAHFKACEWADAVASYACGLQCDSTPPEAAVVLYSNRAAALLKQGSFVIAGDAARAGLALFSGSESLPLELKQKLTYRAREADLGEAVEQAAARTSEVSMTAQTIIGADSPLGTALGDENTTAYFFEAQFRELLPGSKRFLATINVYSCIAVFASSPDGRAFGAHINLSSLLSSLYENRRRGQGGMILSNMSKALQRVFRKVDQSKVTISLVGGHEKMDHSIALETKYYTKEEAMWRFSGVVRRCVAEALPGASIDVSLLNRFDGVDVVTLEMEAQCCYQGQRFQVVALDSHTGNVVTQTKYTHDCVHGKVGPVSESVVLSAGKHVQEMIGRVGKQYPRMWLGSQVHPIMTECSE
ncbi:hypothetical protein T484DRAFT_1763059 [Baffinella frigidus]|nr:hypothetical protein T484DRAFT_1763059 [Cryptophyta sp. CCMP2293]